MRESVAKLSIRPGISNSKHYQGRTLGFKSLKYICRLGPWASADFYPGEGKIFRGAGRGKSYYLPKKCPKTYYFLSKKSKNILFWPAKGGGQETPLALP
jgi:hypothetical protein